MTHLRSLLAVGLPVVLLPSCGLLIGLNDYEVLDDSSSGGRGSTGGEGALGGENSGSGGTNTGGRAGTGGRTEAGGNVGEGAGGSPLAPECDTPSDCDDDNECTREICNDGVCGSSVVLAGDACGGGVCSGVIGAPQCVRCIDDRAGDTQDSGCPTGAPRCDTTGTAVCVGCEKHSDCDDGNECTVDTCTADGTCSLEAQAIGTSCKGDKVCNGVDGAEECLNCVDDEAGAVADTGCPNGARPFCDTKGENSCEACIDDAEGEETDSGCSGDTPKCDDGMCVACTDAADCGDGVSCTNDSCQNGVCTNSADDGNCSGGSVCQPMLCDAALDCQQVDIGLTNSLIDVTKGDGSFEIYFPASWAETGDDYSIFICDVSAPCPATLGSVTASHGVNVGWFGGLHDLTTAISQSVALPAGTVELTLLADTNFQTEETGNNPHDTFTITLTDLGGTVLYTAAKYSNVDAQVTTSVWTIDGLSKTFAADAWAGTTVKLEFEAQFDESLLSDFFIDRIRLTALVCQ